MTLNTPETLMDGYKLGHIHLYPKNTQLIYSNFTARGSRVEGVDKVVFFGLQYFIKRYLIEDWNKNFFSQPLEHVLNRYNRRVNNYLGPDNGVGDQHIKDLHNLGYLPIEIKALPEGSRVNLRVPMLTIQNTQPGFFWLSNAIETLLSDTLWLPCTSATTADMYKKLLTEWAEKTGGSKDFIPFQGHDFSMRGHGSLESACLSGAAHLLSFQGTDTVPAIDFLEQYYGANSDKELVGASVTATEHSVASAGSDCSDNGGDDFDYFRRLITEVYPKGIISLVSDTFDFWRVIDPEDGYLRRLKEVIKNREGKVVIRPDSGDPVKIVTGWTYEEVESAGRPISETEGKGLIQCLYEIFGGTVNDKGYIDLSPCIGAIYGDSITLERAQQISERLAARGFSSTNIVYGIGSFTYQGAINKDAIVTRDTYGFAVKATYAVINGTPKELFKDPVTDDGLKKSARGLLRVDKIDDNFVLTDQCSWEEESGGELQTVFQDGLLLKNLTLAEIRDTLNNQ